MGWFTAAHPGTCVDCDHPITPGQPIVRSGDGYAHAIHAGDEQEAS